MKSVKPEADLSGRDPEDAFDNRLDAGPPPKPPVAVLKVSVTFEQIGKFFKRLLRKRK